MSNAKPRERSALKTTASQPVSDEVTKMPYFDITSYDARSMFPAPSGGVAFA